MIDPLVLVRGVHFAATLWAAGTVACIVLVTAPTRLLTKMAAVALVLAVLSGLAWLAVIAANILDVPVIEIGRDDGIWTVLIETRFGVVACLRLGLAVALGLLLAAPAFPGRRALLLATAAGHTGLLAWVGHAGATPGMTGWLHLASDVIHLLAAAAWLGGLPAVAVTLSAATATTDPAAVTARFSALGIACVGALLASGLINSWQLLAGPGDLIATAYGRVLSLKIALFGAMVAVAAINRYALTPRLPEAVATRALRRNAWVETGIGLGIVLLVGQLGTMIPGGHMHRKAAQVTSEAAFVHIHTEAVMADVTIAPGGGKSTATIRLWREDYKPYVARRLSLALEPREPGPNPIDRAATEMPDGAWHVENLEIPRAGVWIMRLTVSSESGAPVVLDAPIVITQCSNECW